MKTKKNKKSTLFAKIFSIFMICCFAFLTVGCMGSSPDDYDDEDFDGSDFMEEMAVDMYGAKVLYRPDSYDFATGAGSSDYYNQFATQALNEIVSTYELETNYANYTDYVNALEYVTYCLALGQTPETISVTKNDSLDASSSQYYIVKVGTTPIADELTNIKTTFNQHGSIVGLSESQIDKIGDWLVKNLLSNQHSSTIKSTLQTACSKVQLGDQTIDKGFMASEIKEYAGNTFFIFDDTNFPKYEEGQSATAIQPLEYQSVTLMLKDNIQIDEIWIALKYDADLDGTEEGVWDTSKYLDIIVEVNYFSHAKQKLFTVGSQTTRVYDGPYDIMNSPEGADDHGTLMFADFEETCPDQELKGMLTDGAIQVGKFNPDVGGGVLKTDVGTSGYIGLPPVSQSPLLLVATQDARKYYSIIQPAEGELSDSQTYTTGRMNEEMFKGSDGCDYLEITYKVLKTKGDYNTNYKFYTGVAGLFEPVDFDI